jgi:hypothetical protein
MSDEDKYATHDLAWTNTFSGKVCYPLIPEKTDYCIEDIAHSLSMQCRWNGHCTFFYSVAQHSCYAHDLIGNLAPFCGADALMHDAAEAYLSDVPRPIKGHLGGYKALEERTEKIIYEKFNIYSTSTTKHYVAIIDTQLLTREKKLIVNSAQNMTWGFEDVDTSFIDQALPTIERWSPERAEEEFLTRYRNL